MTDANQDLVGQVLRDGDTEIIVDGTWPTNPAYLVVRVNGKAGVRNAAVMRRSLELQREDARNEG